MTQSNEAKDTIIMSTQPANSRSCLRLSLQWYHIASYPSPTKENPARHARRNRKEKETRKKKRVTTDTFPPCSFQLP